ncbi:hypothetical protein [methane-oxidizing endosymbiont of Gigantopelta aegis]|uniref:hypothetical protein n=1 Tax=methane-oxidizing endosymbiont of Gigantopelta aegis TaxID=2794938 RepID=UPI0018DE4810|nr:hypothetical protein [methane-oxidizing endosymbiont of Gigantopelta aegis]
MLQHLPFSFGKAKSLLICETDGFSLSGVVVAHQDDDIQVLHRARSEQGNMAEALETLLAKLADEGWKANGPAVLLTPAVLSTLVELPVSPVKPRPLPQMKMLVQNEVEVLLIQHMLRWSIGNLLLRQGYLTDEQLQTVLDMQQNKPNANTAMSAADQYSFRRFGELAEELGYIKRSQLSACLEGQEWLKGEEFPIECNWSAQGAAKDAPGTFNWLVSCVSQPLLKRWVDLFAGQNIELKALYPVTSCAAALVQKQPDPHVVLQALPGQAVLLRQQHDVVSHLHIDSHSGKSSLELCLESYHALQTSHHEPLWLIARFAEEESLAKELEDALGIEINRLRDERLDELLSAQMLAVARHEFKQLDSGFCLGLQEGGPLPAPLQRPQIRAAILMGILVLLIAVAELSLSLRQQWAQTEHQELAEKWAKKKRESKKVKKLKRQYSQAKQAITDKQAEIKRLQAMLDFYNQVIPGREALILDLLGMLQQVVDDETLFFSLQETDISATAREYVKQINKNAVATAHFELSGWALNEAAAQQLINNVQAAIKQWSMEIYQMPVMAAKGPFNLDGYAVTMHLVKWQLKEDKP